MKIENMFQKFSCNSFLFKPLCSEAIRHFSKLFERSFMALLIRSVFMCSTNFLDSCAIDFGLVESFSPFWIVSVSLNSCSKSPDCNRIILLGCTSEWSFAFELRLGFCFNHYCFERNMFHSKVLYPFFFFFNYFIYPRN